MEAAMKLSRQYYLEKANPEPQRIKFIARRQSYHGITIGSLSMGGHAFRRELFEPILLPNVSHVSPCNPYRNRKNGESDVDYVARLAGELDAEFQRLGPDTVCAFVAEPVVGAVSAPSVNFVFLGELCLQRNDLGNRLRSIGARLLQSHENRLRKVWRSFHLR